MKKVLLASTALALSAGIAAADVSVGGDGRMGVRQNFNSNDIEFTSRIRISFAASGETDGGLTFGGSIRADNAGGITIEDDNNNGIIESNEVTGGGGANGLAGSVFVSGAFGTITMGDVDGAPEAAVGDVSGVGLTGLGDLNEAVYLSNYSGRARSAVRYDYAFNSFGIHLSADDPAGSSFDGLGDDTAVGVAVTYDGGMFTAGLGYETVGNEDHWIVGGSVDFSGATIKAQYGSASGDIDEDQWGLSIDYGFGATTVTAFYADREDLGSSTGYGIGAAYDLGGGAALKGGYVRNDTSNDDAYDFGISMSF